MFDATVQLKDFAHRYFGMLAESCKVPAAPEFATPHRVIRESSAYRLLEFSSDPHSVPTLVLPRKPAIIPPFAIFSGRTRLLERSWTMELNRSM